MNTMSSRNLHPIVKHSSKPLLQPASSLWRGSRKGYSADVDDVRPDPEEVDVDDEEGDEVRSSNTVVVDSQDGNTNPTTATTCRIDFYSHILPKRRYRHNDSSNNRTKQQQTRPTRRRQRLGDECCTNTANNKKKRPHYWTATSTTHQDIDLSLVPLLSSRELDRRMMMTTTKADSGSRGSGAYSPTIPSTASSTSTLSDQWLSSISTSSENVNSNSEKKKIGKNYRFKDDGSGHQNNLGNEEMNISTASPPSSDIVTKARPLAVVDYGSIELDMSGSLLDSIYKIGPPSAGAARLNDGGFTTDWTRMIGGGVRKKRLSTHHRHRDDESPSKRRNDRTTTATTTTAATDTAASALHNSRKSKAIKTPIPAADDVVQEEGCNNSSSTDPPAHGTTHYSIPSSKPKLENIASTTSSGALQVQAISSATASSSSWLFLGSNRMQEGDRHTTEKQTSAKRDTTIISTTKPVEARRMLGHRLPAISKVPYTLDAAISFSPFARVLFCAQPPYTVVHTNAAYISLLQQRSLSKPCVVGGAFSDTTKQLEGESSETYVARMVMEHMDALDHSDDDDDNDESAARRASRSQQPRPRLFYYIFPVLSADDPYSQFLRGYKHDFERRQSVTSSCPSLSDTAAVAGAGAAPASTTTTSFSILDPLQIVEPGGTASYGSSRSTSPTQIRSQYLLQIEPDGRYPY